MENEKKIIQLLQQLDKINDADRARYYFQRFLEDLFEANEFQWYEYENESLKAVHEDVIFFLDGKKVMLNFRNTDHVFFCKGRIYVSLGQFGAVGFYTEIDQTDRVKTLLLPSLGLIIRLLDDIIVVDREGPTIKQFELLTSFIHATDVGVQIADEQGNLVFMNALARERLGFEGLHVSDIHVSDYQPSFKNPRNWILHLEELKRKKGVVRRTFHISKSTRQSIPIEVRVFRKDIGGSAYVFALTRDISERVEMEDKIEVKENMLQAIAESSNELLFNLNFFEALNKVLSIIGKAVKVDRTYLFTTYYLTDGELVVSQRSEWNSGESEPQINNPDLQNVPVTIFEDFIELMFEKKSFQAIVSQLPRTSSLRSTLEPQNIVSILIIPVFVEEKFWGFIGYDDCRVEREWSNAEVAILETLASNISVAVSRDQFLNKIESLADFPIENPSPVLRISFDGEIIQKNNKVDHLIGRKIRCDQLSLSEISFSDFIDLVLKEVVDHELNKQFELLVDNDKYYKVVVVSIAKRSYCNFYFTDVTDLKKVQSQLEKARLIAEEADSAKEDFLASMSHEIRTPLNAIIGFSRHILNSNSHLPFSNQIEDILLSGKHLQSLVENILDFSMINAGKFKLKNTVFEYQSMLSFVTTIIKPMAESKNLTFDYFRNSEDPIFVVGDELRIRQVFLNVLSNAVKFTPKGTVSFKVFIEQRGKELVHFEAMIQDTGMGMDKSFVRHVFDKFSRNSRAENKALPGSGLGMAITKKIIEELDGDIQVQSEVDVGTSIMVSFDLPLSQERETFLETSLMDKQLKNGMKVLVVEDNPINMSVIKAVLSNYNIQVVEAINGQEAIDTIEKCSGIDCVLMDFQMPVMDGLEATQYIRDTLKVDIPIIGLSANAYKKDIDRCLNAGMNAYIVKPFDERKLMKAISNCSHNVQSNKAYENSGKKIYRPVNESFMDLSYLEQLTQGKKEKEQELIKDFLTWIPIAVDELQEAIDGNDVELFRKVVHSLHPNLKVFGLGELSGILEKIKPQNAFFSVEQKKIFQLFCEKIDHAIQLMEVRYSGTI